MNFLLGFLSTALYLFATLIAADVTTVSITASNAQQESSLVDSLYTTIVPNDIQIFNNAVVEKHVKLDDKSCFFESETYTLTEDLSFGFFVEQKQDGSYGIKWYYDKERLFSFDILKVKFRHNNDIFNNIFHFTVFDGFFYSWFTESWDSILAQTFEISVNVKETEIIYSTSCENRDNCTPLQIPYSAPCTQSSSSLSRKPQTSKTTSDSSYSDTDHNSYSVINSHATTTISSHSGSITNPVITISDIPTETSKLHNSDTDSSAATRSDIPAETSKFSYSYTSKGSSASKESQSTTEDFSYSHSQTSGKQSVLSENSETSKYSSYTNSDLNSMPSSSVTVTSKVHHDRPTGVLLSFSVTTSSVIPISLNDTSSVTESKGSYYPIEFDCPTQVPQMFPITDDTILGYYIEFLGNSKYKIDWFFTFPKDFNFADYDATFKHNNGDGFNIFGKGWENGFFYSYTADSWEDLMSQTWDFRLDGFFNITSSNNYYTSILFSSNCGSQTTCNSMNIQSSSSQIHCSAPSGLIEPTTIGEPHSATSTTVTTANSNYFSIFTTTVSGIATSYTTYCPDETTTSASGSTEITIVTDTISGFITSSSTNCPDESSSLPVTLSSSFITITTTVSGIVTSYTTYCPDETTTSASGSTEITIVTDTISGTITSSTTYCPDEIITNSPASSSEVFSNNFTNVLSTSSSLAATVSEAVTSNSYLENTRTEGSISKDSPNMADNCLECHSEKPAFTSEGFSQLLLTLSMDDISITSLSIQSTLSSVSANYGSSTNPSNFASASTSTSTSDELPLSVANDASQKIISFSFSLAILSYFILF